MSLSLPSLPERAVTVLVCGGHASSLVCPEFPWTEVSTMPKMSPRSYPLGPEVQFLIDKLNELRVAEGEEVDDLIDSS